MKGWRMWKSETKKRGEEEGDRWKERDDGKFLETTDIKLPGIATVGQH